MAQAAEHGATAKPVITTEDSANMFFRWVKPVFVGGCLFVYCLFVALMAEILSFVLPVQWPERYLFYMNLLYVGAFAVGMLYIFAFCSKKWERCLYLLLCGSLLVASYTSPITSRTVFLKDLFAVRHGVAVNEVIDRMAPYGCGMDARLYLNERKPFSLSYGHSDEAEYNADRGSINFRDGKSVSAEFSPD